ncbi:hypothetical protein RHSIM_Rhsim11G0112600 [Rhododendron simsii]|uniref:PGG domain-containing protein n=1 Tax=Rhododendron simsii TaxID=118357 RepID=A0A834G8K1_RHOSS|nr:hypothetical protein RHSIM_Rhsim11G0112600 [Rhododendron simsii]
MYYVKSKGRVRSFAIIGKATEMISSAEWHALVFAKLGLLLNLIQIMYQNQSDSPFQTHPATMAISVAAICISGFAAATLLNSKAVKVEEEDKEEQQTTGKYFLYCCRILDVLVLISGVVTLSCLVSVFITNGLGWIVFVSCTSSISALLVGWRFLFVPIFKRTKSGHGELGPSRV